MKTLRLLAILMLTICGFAAAANAQASFTGKVTLPYEVHWGTAILPAGEYTITMNTLHSVTLVQSARNDRAFYTRMPLAQDSTNHPASLLITSVRGEHRVQSMNLPEFGRSFVYEQLSKAELEEIAKAGQIQTVPVIVAKK
jgi:hypothetical protein